MTATTDTTWPQRVAAAHQASVDARAAEEQTIRDAAKHGTSPTDIAEALGDRRNRQRVYAILKRGADGGEPTPPQLTPLVYLIGGGRKERTWKRVESAMWARGWATTHDRTDAWHAARGGVPTVELNFSTSCDRSGGAFYGYHLYVAVHRVRARWQEDPITGGREMDFQHLAGRNVDEPLRDGETGKILDEDTLARLVAEALG